MTKEEHKKIWNSYSKDTQDALRLVLERFGGTAFKIRRIPPDHPILRNLDYDKNMSVGSHFKKKATDQEKKENKH